jgi:cell division transport system permease protein
MNYTLRSALTGLWMDRWLNLLCTLTIATSLFITGLSYVAYINVTGITDRLPDRFSITVFINDDASEDRVREVISEVRALSKVKKVRYVSREDGLRELKNSLGDADYILEGIEGNPLPPALEVGVTGSAATVSGVGRIVKKIKGIRDIDDAYYAPGLLRIISAASRYVDKAGVAIIALLSVAGLFVSYATIKILFYRKQDEIATQKLLGATKGFIRAPFIIEGAVIGAVGGLLSFISLLILYAMVYLRVASQFPLLRQIIVPVELLPAVPMAGLLIGVVGAFVAIGSIRY